jgi:exopolyphosphatase/guanosine-5'-triphosphate,3'-diphosphate pyrophosphatase
VRCACVDIGSNTTRLLVAEPDAGGGLREILARRVFTRLRARPDGTPDLAAIEQVAGVVVEHARVAREAGAGVVHVLATAAVRDAPDPAALAGALEARTGLPLRVLSGEEEARLAFVGATGMVRPAPGGLVGVVDVGGGSCELVAGTVAGGVAWSVSLPLGSGALLDAHVRSDPPGPDELAAIRAAVAAAFAGVRAPAPSIAYAVGGSATSLRRLVGEVLDRETLAAALRTVAALPAAQVASRYSLHEQRAALLPAGLLVLDAAAAALGVPLRSCGGGLREGVLLEELAHMERHGQGT